MQLVHTHLSTLDLLLGGGIPRRQAVIVTGDPGTGKTVLCSEIAFSLARAGTRVVVATAASESQEKLVDELEGFSFFDHSRVGEEIFFISAYPWLKKGPKEAKDILLKTMRERGAGLLFMDGLRSLRDLWDNEAKLRDFLYELNVGVAQLGAVSLLTTEYKLERLMDLPEATTVDGIIALSAKSFGGRVVRRVQVAKLRGRPHLTGEHLLHITAEGIQIVPRLEEITRPAPTSPPSPERAAFGLPELDKLLLGGVPRMTATLMAGSTGVGKTFLGMHFAAEGARRGEPTLLVTHTEPVERMVARAKGISLELEPLLTSGRMQLHYRPVVNVEGDELVAEMLSAVRALGARRLVIDGIGEIEQSVLDRSRLRGLFTSLIIQLRDLGVTTIFVKEVPKIAGPDLDFSDTPISVTAENLLFFRHIELRGRLHRVASVLKMRDSGYDPFLREFEITEHGLRVLGPMNTAEGLLTGTARLTSMASTEGGRGERHGGEQRT